MSVKICTVLGYNLVNMRRRLLRTDHVRKEQHAGLAYQDPHDLNIGEAGGCN